MLAPSTQEATRRYIISQRFTRANDGMILPTVTTNDGTMLTFMMSVPTLMDGHQQRGQSH